MTRNQGLKTMVIAALLCAVGIVIPMYFPKVVIPPMSFTLASHVPIFIAMFISPVVTIAVCLGTTAGFFLSGLPLVVTLRAATHIIFGIVGSFILIKKPDIMQKLPGMLGFGIILGIIHAIGEVIVVTFFFFGGSLAEGFYQNGYIMSVLLLVGVGTVVHSMVDYIIAGLVWKPVSKTLQMPVAAEM